MSKQDSELIQALYDEYQLSALRSRYVGSRKKLQKTEGFSWLSQAVGRLVYWPRQRDFTLDDIYIVQRSQILKI